MLQCKDPTMIQQNQAQFCQREFNMQTHAKHGATVQSIWRKNYWR